MAAEEPHAQDRARGRATLDAALDCIVSMDAAGQVVEWNLAAERTFGYRREEALGRTLAELIVPPSLRDAHRKGLARYLATGESRVLGRRIELTAVRSDGNEFPVELAITRIPGDGPPIFIGYLRDIGERVRAERLRNLRLAVTQQLAQAGEIGPAIDGLLGAVCGGMHWEYGAFWCFRSSEQALECDNVWAAGAGAGLQAFASASRARTFARGEGLPGRVWASGRAEWVLDVRRDANFPRAPYAEAAGLRSAFACPIAGRERTLGVMEFFTGHLREPDAELLETMGTVAGLLAQFIERRQAEQRLRESEARFRAMMDQAPFSMQIFSPEGRTLHVNPAWSALWGVTLEQIGGYNVREDPQLERKGVRPYLERAFAGEAVAIPPIRYDPNETLPERTRHADPVRYVAAVAYPLKDDAGQVREVVLVHEDITARRQAESALRESEEKLRLLADTIPQLAWMANPDGFIFWYNRRWYEYTGTTPEAMEGWGWQSVHDPEVLPAVLERWRGSIASGAPFDMVFPLKGADGVFRPFLTRVNPLRDAEGRILYWFGTNTDISEMKRMEEALREADRRKDEFLATLAHELRNPLAPIVNTLQILKLPALDAPTLQRSREMMERQVRHLVRLVDDLLDMSRIARGKIELRREPLALGALVAAAIETVRPLMDARGHRLEVATPSAPLSLQGDPVRLVQVLGNLLTNAAKYTPPHGRIAVSVRGEAGAAVISIEDSGIGIAGNLLPRVFEPFVQGTESAVREQSGLGIGLTLVKSLVELHGGSVEAASAGAGRGARFTVRLPLSAAGPAAAPAQQPRAAVPARRVLVVDDNRDAADSMAELLRAEGHRVRVAYDGQAALEAAQSEAPQVVFVDLGMPGLDGFETVRRMRALPGMRAATIAALTGWGQEADRRRSAEAGFDLHIVKPAEASALHAALAAAPRAP